MTQPLSDARHALARELAEFDFALRSTLPAVHYQAVSKRLGRLLDASSAYTDALIAAKRLQGSQALVPRFLTDDMHKAMLTAKDPVEAWHAALTSAGVNDG